IDPQAKRQGRDSTAGQLHNDTAYGLTGESVRGVPLVVTRKPFDSLTPAMLDKLRDPHLASLLRQAIGDKSGKELQAALKAFRERPGPYHRIRHVRIIEPVDVIQIRDRQGRAYKG